MPNKRLVVSEFKITLVEYLVDPAEPATSADIEESLSAMYGEDGNGCSILVASVGKPMVLTKGN